ncbi:hypothetical protein SETIT_1G244300v2 [Setaria italica]|uniref:Ribosomal RNA-processing protein 14/surfeit locus protein 6 C-terminal domain-containing protein n=1 Tax=Setaria italica TaxID=4555 RepID=A0A368PNW5_SETIT|nr:ribosomal RNA-processing protein 14 [Setaria italica]RCV07435.1 hypothetical protein SETIT_1G244300v2 [Setaria italica]
MGRKPSAAAAATAATADDESLAATMPADLLAAADCGGVHGHALFFDALVQLIPPRFYLPSGDEDRPWYQGLSKAAKAAMKAQSRANVKAARRARLDPSAPPASTLDLLKKSVADQAAEEEDGDDEEGKSGEEGEESGDEASSEDEDGDEVEEDEEDGDEKDEMPIAPAAVVSEDRSVTYEELRERLHRRIAELRGNRCTRPEFLNKPKKEKGKKAKGKNEKKGKGEGKKRKRDDGTEDAEDKDGKKAKKAEEKPDIMYANVVVDPKEARRRKKRRIKNKKKELEQAKRLQEAKQDPEKANKIAWDTARRRAAGEKVHDDPKLIKESLKKEEKRQQKHAAQWKERQKTVDNQRKEKQKKRTENIRERAHQKKMRKIEKREKKLMRPGFEGRKDGYVNE